MELISKLGKAYSRLKSNLPQRELTFNVLHGRLLNFVLSRVNNGDFTERGLARILNVSQPQMHNVLKGNRKLTPALADKIMQRFGLSIVDLLHENEIKESLKTGPSHTVSDFELDSKASRARPSLDNSNLET